MEEGIYLDNAATSWPKPEEVYRAVEDYMRRCGGTPARGRHPKAREAGKILDACRSSLMRLLGGGPGYRLALTSGATESLNLALKGLLPEGAHVVITELEHNSVLRPLSALREERGVEWTLVEAGEDGTVDPARVREAIGPKTRLVACTSASNMLGTLVDVEGVTSVARERGVPVLVDAAQTVGVVPVDAAALGIDMLAFTGHKSLLGPPGTGGLLFRESLNLRPLKEGGTGTFGEVPVQPTEFPERYETGSPNMYGIAGLCAGVAFVEKRGVAEVRRHKSSLAGLLMEGLRGCPGVRVYGTERPGESVGIVSFNVGAASPDMVADQLWKRSRIMVRSGIHCAPYVHRRIGTTGRGTVRVGIGYGSRREDIELLTGTVREIASDDRVAARS